MALWEPAGDEHRGGKSAERHAWARAERGPFGNTGGTVRT